MPNTVNHFPKYDEPSFTPWLPSQVIVPKKGAATGIPSPRLGQRHLEVSTASPHILLITEDRGRYCARPNAVFVWSILRFKRAEQLVVDTAESTVAHDQGHISRPHLFQNERKKEFCTFC